MSASRIPGLSTLVPAAEGANARSALPTDDQAALRHLPLSTTNHTKVSEPTQPEGTGDRMAIDNPPSPPSLTSGLEALLGGLEPVPESTPVSSDTSNGVAGPPSEIVGAVPAQPSHVAQLSESPEDKIGDGQQDQPEWEVDSSPYESSSSSCSSDDSDDGSSDEKDYRILAPEETARILMEMDGGSDEEGDGKGKSGGSGQVRTKNEQPETIIPRPDVDITPETEIVELGAIEHFVGNIAVIKANTTGEYQVLDTGSVLCLEDRTVIAALADVIAAVREPRYTAGFANEEEIKVLGLQAGTKIFYPPALANLGLTQVLKANKGTDASNWHDEEVAEDEIEFSDDEKEAEHKRQLKAKKRGTRSGRDGTANRGVHHETITPDSSGVCDELRYDEEDEGEDHGPYRPLARPVGFGQNRPSHGGNGSSRSQGGVYRGKPGDFRGKGGRSRTGHGIRANPRGGYSAPPRSQRQGGQATQSFQEAPPQQFNLSATQPVMMNGQAYPFFPPLQPTVQPGHQQPAPQYPFHWLQNAQQGLYTQSLPQVTANPDTNMIYYDPNFGATMQNQSRGPQTPGNDQWNGQHGGYSNQWSGEGSHG